MPETAVESLSMNELPAEPDRAMTDEQLISMLVDRARSEGLQLTGEGGLLQQLTKRVLESALEGEITDHLGYDRHDPAGKNSGNSRNGTRGKTVVTDVGPVEVRVPRDVAGTFEPQLVRKRQRRLSGVDEMVLSLSAKGLTHGEISAHLAEVYGAQFLGRGSRQGPARGAPGPPDRPTHPRRTPALPAPTGISPKAFLTKVLGLHPA
jgi:hypothetical protein